MFDIKWIRDNPAAFDAGLARRRLEPVSKSLLDIDARRRAIIGRLETALARRNAASKEIGQAKAKKDDATAQVLMAEVAELKATIPAMEAEEKSVAAELQKALEVIPNLPRDDVPEGADETGNKEIRKVGTPPKLGGMNKPRQHFEIGEALGLMDFETAAKLSGARFVVLKGQLARLERALGQFMLDLHTGEYGYTEVNPPMLVRDEAMYGTAQLPKFADDQFFAGNSPRIQKVLSDSLEYLDRVDPVVRDQSGGLGWISELSEQKERLAIEKIALEHTRLWLIPTAEVPLTNLVREKITDEAELPIRVTAFTPCFRAEAGAAGKDTRGMIRQHQFSKVELVSITTPEQALDEHERMTQCAEEVLKRLGLAYRTVLLCTGDMGFASQKTYDIEVWLPGQGTYREISSCSVCGDFQARRMNARYRPKGAKDTRFVHTLNGSGLAVGRALIAVLENYQQPDGSVIIPDVLVPYMGGKTKIEKAV